MVGAATRLMRTRGALPTYNAGQASLNCVAPMKSTVRSLGLLAGTLLAAGCSDIVGERIIVGSGPVEIESRSVGNFSGVSNSTVADVEILHGFTDRVFIRAERNILPHIRVRVQNGVLRIYTDDVTLRPRSPIVVEVDIVTLRTLDNSGSGFMRGQFIDATRLEVNSSGAGDIDLPDLLADSLVVISSGSGDVTAEGGVERLRLNMSAGGRVDTRDLTAVEANATVSGSGTATIRVSDYLRAVLSGSGSVRYFGSPAVDADVSGTGVVERAGS